MSVVFAAKKGAQVAAKVAGQAFGVSQRGSQELLGYDFVNLGVKLFVFYAVAFLMAKYLELVAGAASGLRSFLRLLGVNAPAFLPQEIIDFYQNGYHGVKFWDLVKFLSIILVIVEYTRYVKTQKDLGGQPSAMTEGIFFLIIGFLLLVTIPELWQRIKDYLALAQQQSTEEQQGGPYTF